MRSYTGRRAGALRNGAGKLDTHARKNETWSVLIDDLNLDTIAKQ